MELSRRNMKVLKNYEWLISLADDFRIIEELEFSLLNNKLELDAWTFGYLKNVKITNGSLCVHLEEKIELLENIILKNYKNCKSILDLFYEFDSVEYRVLYDILTTTETPYTIGKLYKMSASDVYLILDTVNLALSNVLNDFTWNSHSKLNSMDPVDYLHLKVQELFKKINVEDVNTPVKTLTQGMV